MSYKKAVTDLFANKFMPVNKFDFTNLINLMSQGKGKLTFLKSCAIFNLFAKPNKSVTPY